MAGHASTVDDPEKHFLGNLLDEDPCFNPPPLSEGTSSGLGAIPPVSVISGVGPISTSSLLRSYWPEPPPPYSPPIQTQWYTNEPQPFSRQSPPDFHFSSGQPTFITQPQIHHHHHNLHHHTHTHNVVENHHHYPITAVSVPANGYGFNIQSETPTDFTKAPKGEEGHPALDFAEKNDDHRTTASEALPSPAVPLGKPPLSYRDVAAKIDQCACENVPPVSQAKKHQQQPDFDNRAGAVKVRDLSCAESSKSSCASRERKPTSNQGIEFQKITRKKVTAKKEKLTLCDSPSLPMMEKASAVDTPTKYEVLQNLTSKVPRSPSITESVPASKREREPMRAAMVFNERSRSNSQLPRNGTRTVIDVVARPKRAIDIMEKKKQATGSTMNLTQQRRRAVRKRSEFGWMERAVVVMSRLSCWVEFICKWMLNLVVDVCLQVYDVVSYSANYLAGSIHSSMRRMLLWINASFLSGLSSVRQVDVRRLFRVREPESLMWGLEENTVLPTTGEEALERFLRVPRCLDAYGVLGLRASCTEEDVRRHYKRLNMLLNPDKNPLEGAEEAHELVNKAYQAISTPEARKAYNFTRIRPYKNVLHHEIGELWERICDRVVEARNSMYCDCGRRHTRIALNIRQSEARYCRRCKARHPARANDIWVESRLCGLLWVYFTCCDGIVYDITDWATCEANFLKHVRPNSHTVQYRLVSPARSSIDSTSNKQQNVKLRELADAAEEFRADWGRSGHAQVSYLPLEPRDEDRSRRAANRRQKKWR